jgi:hypothetical protein
MGTTPGDEIAALCDAIRALLAKPIAARDQSLVRLEDTLTEGYAYALTLEAERWRLERKIGELGGDVRLHAEGSADELASLAGQLSHATRRLSGLRELLAALRERTDKVRAKAAYAAVENPGG